MEPGLNIGPPPALEKLVWHLLPPVVREEVAGDLWERFRSPLRYLADALATLPFVIASQDAYMKAVRTARDRKTIIDK